MQVKANASLRPHRHCSGRRTLLQKRGPSLSSHWLHAPRPDRQAFGMDDLWDAQHGQNLRPYTAVSIDLGRSGPIFKRYQDHFFDSRGFNPPASGFYVALAGDPVLANSRKFSPGALYGCAQLHGNVAPCPEETVGACAGMPGIGISHLFRSREEAQRNGAFQTIRDIFPSTVPPHQGSGRELLI
jgi:hypothetical protein